MWVCHVWERRQIRFQIQIQIQIEGVGRVAGWTLSAGAGVGAGVGVGDARHAGGWQVRGVGEGQRSGQR